MWIILPIKNIDQAKQRLAGELTPEERRQLFEIMLTDVFDAIAGSSLISGTLIVSRDAKARDLAERFGAELLVEPQNEGQSLAVQRGVDHVMARGARGVMTLPGDAPAVTAREIDQLVSLNGDTPPALTLSPSHDRRGTNCIVASPGNLITFHFGHQSFQPHLEEAEKAGVTPRICPLPGIGLDIDTPEDVLKFMAQENEPAVAATATVRFLRDSGIVQRLRDRRAQGNAG